MRLNWFAISRKRNVIFLSTYDSRNWTHIETDNAGFSWLKTIKGTTPISRWDRHKVDWLAGDCRVCFTMCFPTYAKVGNLLKQEFHAERRWKDTTRQTRNASNIGKCKPERGGELDMQELAGAYTCIWISYRYIYIYIYESCGPELRRASIYVEYRA